MSNDKTIIADSSALFKQTTSNRTAACLVQYSGKSLGKRFPLTKNEITIGRAPEADIMIQEKSVSRQHAKCFCSRNVTEILDLNSSNGTFVNDAKITQKFQLRDGDIIRTGTILLKYFSQNNIDNIFHDKIYRMATIDVGTQIFNKKYLLETLDEEFEFSQNTGRSLSLVYFDLDHFKKVNDTYGHNAGDFILRESAGVVQKAIRKDDIFCRYGGEEFVILMPNTDARKAYELAERFRQQVANHAFNYEGQKITQTVSIGVSQLNPTMSSPTDLLEDADAKLYQSKKSGRNQTTV